MTYEEIENRVKEVAGYCSFTDDDFEDYAEMPHREVFDDCVSCYKQGRIDIIKEIIKLNEESCGDIDYIISKIKEEY